MKRKSYYAMLLPFIILAGCNKGSNNPNNGNGNGNGGGGNGGGGNSSSLSVTGFSPEKPYLDDTLIINGTGFNTDKAKDTVLFNFFLGKIISATATQLKVGIPSETEINMTFLWNSKLEVRANGKKFPIAGGIWFKRPVTLTSIDDPDTHTSIGKPDDSLVFNGSGYNVNGNGMTVSIGSKSLTGYKIDSNFHGIVSARLPKTFFGLGNDESIVEQKVVTIKNADGRTAFKTFNFYTSPRMVVFGAQFEQDVYSMAALALGGVVKLNVSGRNLKDDTQMVLSGPNNYSVISSLPVSGFPSSVSISFGSNFPSPGFYSVNLSRSGFTYAIANFHLVN